MNVCSPYLAATASQSTSLLGSSASGAASSTSSLDAFVGSNPAESADLTQMSMLRKLAVAGGFALAGLAALPQAAQAAQVPQAPTASQATVVAQPGRNQLAQTLGLSARGAARLSRDKDLQAKAAGLPDVARDMFGSYSPAQKQLLYKALTQRSSAGFVSVDNREAFVTGKALGHDAFPTIWVNIEKIAQEQGLDKSEAHELKNHFLVMTTFSAADRDAIASLIVADQAP